MTPLGFLQITHAQCIAKLRYPGLQFGQLHIVTGRHGRRQLLVCGSHLHLAGDLSGQCIQHLAELLDIASGHTVVEATDARKVCQLAILFGVCCLVRHGSVGKQVQHEYRDTLLLGHLPQAFGIQAGAGKRIIGRARTGIRHQHDIAGIVA